MVCPVEFAEVAKAYVTHFPRQTVQALADVSFRVEPGEVFGLLGPNRAGKTTLVKILLTLCRPTSGRVLRFGKPPGDRGTLAKIGYMHENQAFPRYLSATSLLGYYGALAQVPWPVLSRRIPELLKKVELSDRAEESIARFSKGMLQRLGLAQALLNEPELLVLDEPAEGLDLLGRQLVAEAIAAQKKRGGSVLLITHTLLDVEPLLDRVAVLVSGRLVHLGSVASLLTDGRVGNLGKALHDLYLKHHHE